MNDFEIPVGPDLDPTARTDDRCVAPLAIGREVGRACPAEVEERFGLDFASAFAQELAATQRPGVWWKRAW